MACPKIFTFGLNSHLSLFLLALNQRNCVHAPFSSTSSPNNNYSDIQGTRIPMAGQKAALKNDQGISSSVKDAGQSVTKRNASASSNKPDSQTQQPEEEQDEEEEFDLEDDDEDSENSSDASDSSDIDDIPGRCTIALWPVLNRLCPCRGL